MKSKSAKAKGRRLQNEVRERLLAFGLAEDDVRTAVMGESGEDVPLSPAGRSRFPFSVECKNTERLNIWDAWKQAVKNSKGKHVPLVIFRRNRSETLCVLRFENLLSLLEERGNETET